MRATLALFLIPFIGSTHVVFAAEVRDESFIRVQLDIGRRLASSLAEGCLVFEPLGPLAHCVTFSSKPEAPCRSSVELVRCQTARNGWYVPVAIAVPLAYGIPCRSDADPCIYNWTLWFVPFDRRLPPKPLFEPHGDKTEDDLAFTTFMGVLDLDGDGLQELRLGRAWSHPEGVGSGEQAVGIDSTGAESVVTALDYRLKDADSDGQFDILLDFTHTENGAGCDAESDGGWNAIGVDGPSLLLHAVRAGQFTLHDEIARQGRLADCPSVGLDVSQVHSLRGDDALARALLCAQADGASPATMHDAVDTFCSVPYDNQKDCSSPRRHVCRFPEVLHAWIDSLYSVELWANGWSRSGECSRCCPRSESRFNAPAAVTPRRPAWL
jgi:hypothetical protein